MENLKNGTKIKWGKWDLKVVERPDGRNTIKTEDGNLFENTAYNWTKDDYEILTEEDKEIDIQAIKELDEELYGGKGHLLDERIVRMNELIKAVKQIDKKINGSLIITADGITGEYHNIGNGNIMLCKAEEHPDISTLRRK